MTKSRGTGLSVVVLTLTLTILSRGQVSMSNGQSPVLNLANVRTLPGHYEGYSKDSQYLNSGRVSPLSLASADFDGDGIDDLVIGYASPDGGGIISVRSGNIDAFASRSAASWKMLAENQFVSPFADTGTVLGTPEIPTFVATGQFFGQIDLVTAARGGRTLYILSGNGRGEFAPPTPFAVPGPICAMAAGRFGNDIQRNSVVVGIGGPKPSLLVYRGFKQTLKLIASYPLAAPASSFDFDDLDGDGHPDAIMVSDGKVFILHASGANAKPELDSLSLPFSAVAAVSGFFTHDRAWRRQIAVVDSTGTTHIVVHGNFDSRPWMKGEVKAMRDALVHNQPNPFSSEQSAPAGDGWKVLESFPSSTSIEDTRQIVLLRAPFFRRGLDDILVMNSHASEASYISHRGTEQGASTFVPGLQSHIPTSVAPLAALVVNVSAGQPGVVLLSPNSADPLMAPPPSTITFTVTTGADSQDANPGDGVCADHENRCSLRAAVMEVDAEAPTTVGPFKIMLPPGDFQLTIAGQGTENASTGHLDLKAPVTILGSGVGATFITQTNPGGVQDNLFLIDASEENTPSYSVALQALTIEGGHATFQNTFVAQGGGIYWEAGVAGTGRLALNDVNITSNFATDPNYPATADGGGLALYNIVNVTHPAAVTIAGSNSAVQNNTASDVGGGIALRGPVSLTMTGTTVSSNLANGAGFKQGGGLFSSTPSGATSSSPSYLHGCTISGNTAGSSGTGDGGGIWTSQSLTIDQGSVITRNISADTGGGISTDLQFSSDLVAITASTITNNQAAAGNGGGIEVDGGSQSGSANLQSSFNRIFGNTANTGVGTGLDNSDGIGTPLVSDNWWGCNGGPQSPGDGCDQVAGNATIGSFVTLGMSANPNPVLDLTSTTLTASFQDSNPNFPSNLNAFAGLQVSFSNPVNGTLSNESPITSGTATATATFTASASPTAYANVQIDNAVVPATIQVSDFSTTSSKSSQTVNVGTASASFTLTVGAIDGFGGVVNLAVTSSSGLSANVTPPSVTGSGTVTLTVQTASVTSGTYSLTVTGTSGSISHAVTVQLTIANFAVSITPATQTAYAGASPSPYFTISVSSSTGFNGPLSLTFSGAPSGSSLTYSTLNLPNGPTSSILNIPTPRTGTYTMNVTATDSTSVSRSTSATLIVSPDPISVPSTFSLTITLNSSPPYRTGYIAPFTIKNTGSSALNGLSASGTVSGNYNYFGVYLVDSIPGEIANCTSPLAPGASCTAQGYFADNDNTDGTITGTLTIQATTTNGTLVSATIAATATVTGKEPSGSEP